jgi:protease I
MRRSPELLQLVADIDTAGKPVGSICHAAWVLVSAKILKGRTATCYFAIKDDLTNAGATYVDQEVVVDRNLVTSRRPDDLPAFMREFLKLLSK